MQTQEKHYHEIAILGELYPIAYPIAALDRFAQKMGKDVFAALSEIGTGNLETMSALVWVGLQSGAKRAGTKLELKEGDLSELLSVTDFNAAAAILTKYTNPQGAGVPTTDTTVRL